MLVEACMCVGKCKRESSWVTMKEILQGGAVRSLRCKEVPRKIFWSPTIIKRDD